MTKKTIQIIFKFLIAVPVLIGIITQLVIAIINHESIVNFFSFFTTLGNLIASIVLVVSAVGLIKGKTPTKLQDAVRGAALIYMVIVGLVYNILLAGTPLGDLLPWVNHLFHHVMPIAIIIDWVLQPPTSKIAKKTVPLWLSFPVLYVFYSLIRGAITGFYPYAFFNPATQGGYVGVAIYVAVMFVAILAVGFGFRLLGNKLSSLQAKH